MLLLFTVINTSSKAIGMPFNVKLFFSIVSVIIAVAICFSQPSSNKSVEDFFWRGGKKDPFRNMLYRVDGTFRSYSKAGILLFIGFLVLSLWLLVPSK